MAKPKFEPPTRVQRVAARRSEGHPLPLTEVRTSSEHTGYVTFGVDIGAAPVPQRRYACELCTVKAQNGDVRLIFAQRSLGPDAFESALVVRMNPHAARQFLKSLDLINSPSIATIAEQMKIAKVPLTEITQRPHQMANVVANLASVAVSGYETCIDFVHASPFAMRAASTSKELAVEPVVRVDIPTALFMSLIDGLRSAVAAFPDVKDPFGLEV
jgi:hypothetical protein